MAKRANPFIEDFVTQSKIHVSLKQFNNNEERLKKVYDKTLELLFKGAKKTFAAQESLNSDEGSATNKRDKMKQLFIGKDGSLLHAGSMVDTKISKQCKCGGAIELQCAYCEVPLCGSCQVGCALCQGPYCSHCTLIGSEGSQVCFSCCG